MASLTDLQTRILLAYHAADPQAEEMHAVWSSEFHVALGEDLKSDFDGVVAAAGDLRKQKLLAGEGRGKTAFLWLTPKGQAEAAKLAEVKTAAAAE
jgi:hypothetical protein